MRLQSTKAAGSFALQSYGSLELIIHMEADPRSLSFARFNFHTILPPHQADAFHSLPAYLLRHELGVFVIAVDPDDLIDDGFRRAYWEKADRILASRNIWLFATTSKVLQAEPQWSNAQQIARCSHLEVDPVDEARVIDFLGEAGQAPLIECARRCKASRDSCDAALKLVSNGTLHFDVSAPLSLYTPVRLRPFPSAGRLAWLQPALHDFRTFAQG